MEQKTKFGEIVEGYNIPVLNEREIRAAAGLMFVFLFIGVSQAGAKLDFTLVKFFIVIFLIDFIIRLFISPRFSPFLIAGKFLTKRQTPEYVGAPQKKFAWSIGLSLSVIMGILLIGFNIHSPVTGLGCMFCLIFLLFESAFGICLGCLIYDWFHKEKAQHCPGEICEVKDRHQIQKINRYQTLIFLGFIIFIVITSFYFGEFLSQAPSFYPPDLME